MFKIAAFYQFKDLPHYEALQPLIKARCEALGISGTILLAKEGINSTLEGSVEAVDQFISDLENGTFLDTHFDGLELKFSEAKLAAFRKLKVRLKSEIVALKSPQTNPNKQVGTYVSPQDWNDLLDDPELVVIDTRNEYEVDLGTFRGAINPKTRYFRQFQEYVQVHLDPKKHKKVAMFCTGGIRCEKASSYMLEQGFEEVYHLKGGILQYLEDVPQQKSKWEGDCFVFDERIAVTHGLKEAF